MIENRQTLADHSSPVTSGWIPNPAPSLEDKPERRSRNRYPIRMALRYRRISRLSEHLSKGHTVDLSPDGIFVHTESRRPVEIDSRLEISIEWPIRLNGEIPLQLVAQGRVVRTGATGFAVAIDRHELRTAKRKPNFNHPNLHSLDRGSTLPGFTTRPGGEVNVFA